MAQQILNDGVPLLEQRTKINQNFTELFTAVADNEVALADLFASVVGQMFAYDFLANDVPAEHRAAILDGTTTYDVSELVRARVVALGRGGCLLLRGKKYVFSTSDGGDVISAYIRISVPGFTIIADPDTRLTFTDGSVAGIYVTTTAQLFRLQGGLLYGTNTTTPAIELLRISAPYPTIERAGFAFADICANFLGVAGTGVYVGKIIACQYSNSNQNVTVSGSAVADMQFIGNTHGTTTQGTDPSVEISSPGCVFRDYFETMNHTGKPAFRANTGTVSFVLEGKWYDSGEIVLQNSVRGDIRIQADICYSATNARFIRVDGGATADLTGSELYGNGAAGGIFGVSASGAVLMGSGTIKNYQTGVGFSSILTIGNTLVASNGTGLSAGASSSGEATGVVYSGNTTDVSVTTGSAFHVGRKESVAAAPGAGASITPNAGAAGQYVVTMPAGNITINSPSNSYPGARLTFVVIQDATGGRTLTWNAVFKKSADGAGTANQRGFTSFVFDGAYWVQESPLIYYS